MVSRTPRLTIGMPVFNGGAFLEQAVESFLAQTFGDFRLVISDNASTDDTPEIATRLLARDKRISFMRSNTNRGAIWNFNAVFRVCDSPLFKWAAADDFVAPTYLARCVQLLDESPNAVWVHSISRHVDHEGCILSPGSRYQISYASRHELDVARRFENVLLGKSCLDSYGIIRVAALNKTRLLRPIFGSEKLLLAELALLGGYCEVDEELFYSRLHQAMAGALETSKSQHEFISPLTAPPHWIRMRLLWGYVTAVARAPISPIARLKSLGKIGKYLLQIRKWRSVILRTLLGKGTGGDVRIAT